MCDLVLTQPRNLLKNLLIIYIIAPNIHDLSYPRFVWNSNVLMIMVITRMCAVLVMLLLAGWPAAMGAGLASFTSFISLTTSSMSMMSSWLSRKSFGGRLGPLQVSRPHKQTVACNESKLESHNYFNNRTLMSYNLLLELWYKKKHLKSKS